jgi:hypothetical protein
MQDQLNTLESTLRTSGRYCPRKVCTLFTYKTEKIQIRSREHLDLDLDQQPALQQPLDTLQQPLNTLQEPLDTLQQPLQRCEVSCIYLWVHGACVCKDTFLQSVSLNL